MRIAVPKTVAQQRIFNTHLKHIRHISYLNRPRLGHHTPPLYRLFGQGSSRVRSLPRPPARLPHARANLRQLRQIEPRSGAGPAAGIRIRAVGRLHAPIDGVQLHSSFGRLHTAGAPFSSNPVRLSDSTLSFL